MGTALITGASRGLGRALAGALVDDGWAVVIDARGEQALAAVAGALAAKPGARVRAIAGDVADQRHRAALVDAADELGGLDLLVNNASLLGPSPQPTLDAYPLDVLAGVYEVNVLAPLGLVQLALPLLRASAGTVVNVTSDAAVEGYEGWGGYGSSKAALEQVSHVLAAEEPGGAGLLVRPRRHAHGDAPGGLPGRGHLRPARARDRRACPAPPARRATAERPVPGQRPAGGGGPMTAATLPRRRSAPTRAHASGSSCPPGSRRSSRQRLGASPVTRCGCSSPAARPASSSTAPSRCCRPSSIRATSWS